MAFEFMTNFMYSSKYLPKVSNKGLIKKKNRFKYLIMNWIIINRLNVLYLHTTHNRNYYSPRVQLFQVYGTTKGMIAAGLQRQRVVQTREHCKKPQLFKYSTTPVSLTQIDLKTFSFYQTQYFLFWTGKLQERNLKRIYKFP